ncbi:MAG: chemotaxis protein CheA [Gemmatimonadaceae bacterium]|nr:chemotaxis protein CheA [Gemmatimonadaceae bacterium]
MDAARYAALFAAESREHLAEIDEALLELEQRLAARGLLDAEAADAPLAAVFRAMHSLKGMAGAMGHELVEQLAHALESRCEPLRDGSESLTDAVLELLFDGTALLRQAIVHATGDAVALHDAASSDGPELSRRAAQLMARLGAAGERTPNAPPSARPSAHPSAQPLTPPAALRHAASAADETSDLFPVARGSAAAAGAEHAESWEPATDSTPHNANLRHVDVRLTTDCPLKGVRALLVLSRLQQVGLVRSTYPEQAQWTSEQFDGQFRVMLITGADDDSIAQAVRSAGDVAQVQVYRPAAARTAQHRGTDVHVAGQNSASPSVSAASARRDAAGLSLEGPAAFVRVDARRLDALLDLVGELVITRDRLLRAVESSEHPDRETQRAARDTARLVSVLQDEVLQARLLPMAQVFDRFPRVVRDMARDLGKEVRFVMEGRDLAVDRSLLDALVDPLLHLLRNAIDHGLEDSATRAAAGKPASGELIVRAARDRASVVVQVQDDGRGIDREAVRRRAETLGLLSAAQAAPDAPPLDDDALLAIIAHPGFSTASSVSRVSGRGVGVDVVNTRVRALGGQLELETIAGVGTLLTMRLPASLAITRALLVQVAGETFALPAAQVEEALVWHDDLAAPGSAAISLRDERIPLVALEDVFGLERAEGQRDPERHVVVAEWGGRRAALLVDALLAQQDIVVKPLERVRGAAPWFSGATVLGDGSPALIVDVTGVV